MEPSTAVLDHYKSVIGPQFARNELQSRLGTLSVLRWESEDNDQGVTLYATLGTSDLELPRSPEHRAEVFIGLLPDADRGEVAATLADVAFAHRSIGKDWQAQRTMAFDKPLWSGTRMVSVWTRPGAAVIPSIELPDGLHVQFLQVRPLHEEEVVLLKALGPDTFIRQCEAMQLPFWDPFRPAAALG